MKKLNFYRTSNVDELAWPEEKQEFSLDTPALKFFTDFINTEPLVIEDSTPAIEAKQLMLKSHVRLKFVVNRDDQFLGIICAEYLIDRKIVQKISEGYSRQELLVKDLMTAKKDLLALDIEEVSRVPISHVITALKNNGQQHCLVIDRGPHKIRGIFSASDISRKLHLAIDIQDTSSFYKVFSAVY